LVQKSAKADPISPENYDPWVYEVSKDNMEAFPNWHWAEDHGHDPGLAQMSHHKKHHGKPDVAERGMEEEVHHFVSDSIPPLNTRLRSS
jgi:hypothetical protein